MRSMTSLCEFFYVSLTAFLNTNFVLVTHQSSGVITVSNEIALFFLAAESLPKFTSLDVASWVWGLNNF